MFDGQKMMPRTWQNPELKPGSSEQHYTVTREDLPLHCPVPGTTLWDAHPRVFLPIARTGRAMCPYCGTEFTLVDDGGGESGNPVTTA